MELLSFEMCLIEIWPSRATSLQSPGSINDWLKVYIVQVHYLVYLLSKKLNGSSVKSTQVQSRRTLYLSYKSTAAKMKLLSATLGFVH